jgi:hypothetical protein
MLTIKERRRRTRRIEGWATSVLLETGAIRECGEHGWMKDRTDPDARHRAVEIAADRDVALTHQPPSKSSFLKETL